MKWTNCLIICLVYLISLTHSLIIKNNYLALLSLNAIQGKNHEQLGENLLKGQVSHHSKQNETSPRPFLKKLCSIQQIILSFFNFSRLHTLFGTTLSVFSIYFFALPLKAWSSKLLYFSVFRTLIIAWATNIYITGLNQIIDVEIDKINKSYLPLPSAELSITAAKTIVILALLIALIGANIFGSIYLQVMIYCSLVLGTLYSVPPFQFKKNSPFLSACSIASVRGPLINIGVYFHARKEIYENLLLYDLDIYPFPKDLAAVTIYFTIISLIIAVMKDIPDVSGDKYHNILTYSIIFGPKKVFR